MKLKKSLISLFAIVIALFILSSCGSNEEFNIVVEGAVASKSIATNGENIILTLETPFGMKFSYWETTGIEAKDIIKEGAVTYFFKMPKKNVTIKAVYEEIEDYMSTIGAIVASVEKTSIIKKYDLTLTREVDSLQNIGAPQDEYYRVDQENEKATIGIDYSADGVHTYFAGGKKYTQEIGNNGAEFSRESSKWEIFNSTKGMGRIQLNGLDVTGAELLSIDDESGLYEYTLLLSENSSDLCVFFNPSIIVEYTNITFVILINSEGYWIEANLSYDFSFDYNGKNYSGTIRQKTTVTESDSPMNLPTLLSNYSTIEDLASNKYTYSNNYSPLSYLDKILPSAPETESYTNTVNTDFFEFPFFLEIAFDEKTGLVVVANANKICFFDYISLSLIKELTVVEITDISVDNGILVVASGWRGLIEVYEISSLKRLSTLTTGTDYWYDALPYLVEIDGDNIFYSHVNQWCEVYMWNYKTESVASIRTENGKASFYAPELTLDKSNHRLYITETGASVSYMYTICSLTGEIIKYGKITDEIGSVWKERDAYFDGALFHAGGVTFNSDATMVSSDNLTFAYCNLNDFTPVMTLFSGNSIDVVSGYYKDQYYVAFYDKSEDAYIEKIQFFGESAIHLGGTRYLLVGASGNYISIIDIANSKPLAGNDPVEFPMFSYTEFGNTKRIEFDDELASIDKAVVYGKHLYLLLTSKQMVIVIDPENYTLVHYFRFLYLPSDIDVHDDKLVVALGYSKKFAVINLTDYSMTYVDSVQSVFQVAIYGDLVYYCGTRYDDSVFQYNLATMDRWEITEHIGVGDYPVVLTDKSTGELYFGGGSGTRNVMYKMTSDQTISLLWSRDYFSPSPFIAGNYIGVFGYLFNTKTGAALTDVKYNSIVPSGYGFDSYYFNIGISYYDGLYSAYVSYDKTIIYDTINETTIATVDISYSTTIKVGDDFLVLEYGTNCFYRITTK